MRREDVTLRRGAGALGHLGRAAVAGLRELLGATAADVRAEAAVGQDELGPVAVVAVPDLALRVEDEDASARSAAERALRRGRAADGRDASVTRP